MHPCESTYLDWLYDLLYYANMLGDANNPAYAKPRTGRASAPWVSLPYPVTIRHQVGVDCRLPLLTTKKMHTKSILAELVWFLRGDTNVRWLQAHGVTIWDEWADAKGDLGPVYGHQWRRWRHEVQGSPIDQVQRVLDGWRRDPFDRGLVVSAWNVADLSAMALRPCHYAWQITCPVPGVMDIHVQQRSADWFLGVPFNLVSYSALLVLLAKSVGVTPGTVWWNGADCHLYLDHIDAARKQLDVARSLGWLCRSGFGGPLPQQEDAPRLVVSEEADVYHAVTDEDALTLDMLKVTDYNPIGPAIRAPVAV